MGLGEKLMTIVKVALKKKKKFCTLCPWFDLNEQTLAKGGNKGSSQEPIL